jgi:hypothetical protein
MDTCVPAPIGPADTAAQLVGHEFTKLEARCAPGQGQRGAIAAGMGEPLKAFVEDGNVHYRR